MTKYQICTRCVMDTSDPTIEFDDAGVCSHCRMFETRVKPNWFPNEEGKRRLDEILSSLKSEAKGKPYDCVLGLSGGLDSSYLALKAKEWGLRPLCMHVDAGWNSEISVRNIEQIVKALGFDLHTYVVDWDEMRDLQLAFFRANVNNQDIPQDHAFFSALYSFAVKNGIRHVLSGGNYSTESVLPESWVYNAMDLRFLRAVHQRYGRVRLKSYPTVNFFQYYLYYPYIRKMRVIRPLNYIHYDKATAIRELEEKIGFRYYGGKHYESRFTRFFQSYYLPKRFGFDKRRAHLTSMVLAGSISREEALRELGSPPSSDTDVRHDIEYFIKKLRISRAEYDRIMAEPVRSHEDFPNNEGLFRYIQKLKSKLSVRKSVH